MSDFKAQMHLIQFCLGLGPRPRWGSIQRSPDLLAGFKQPTFKLGEAKRWRAGAWDEEEKKEERIRREGRGGTPKGWFISRCPKFWKIPWLQNWSDWRGRQHRRLPRAANTLTPPLCMQFELISARGAVLYTTQIYSAPATSYRPLVHKSKKCRKISKIAPFSPNVLSPKEAAYADCTLWSLIRLVLCSLRLDAPLHTLRLDSVLWTLRLGSPLHNSLFHPCWLSVLHIVASRCML